MVRILVEAGADPAQKNHDGVTAFHVALCALDVMHSDTEIVRFLLESPSVHGQRVEGSSGDKLNYDRAIALLRQQVWDYGCLMADHGSAAINMLIERLNDNELAKRIKRLLAI
ncbi:uncharacterized protein N7446_012607 [Penicillium canescens]|nr:uncharacterized protein N7446_012607 [Penicillium canescens]KAJ6045743.1 hypothetical protein N7446_012607 [Penicillium canescens]